MDDLRAALDLDGLTWPKHRDAVEALRGRTNHSITFIEHRDRDTCATYTLDLSERAEYETVVWLDNIFAGRDFIEWLVRSKLTRMSLPRPGALILYFSGEEWRHIGEMVDTDRVRSKWGEGFPVYEHGIWEVPEAYGDTVRYFEPVTGSDALAWFLEFARTTEDQLNRRTARWTDGDMHPDLDRRS